MSVARWAEVLLASGLPVDAPGGVDPGALSLQLDEMWRSARACWPSVELSEEASLAHLALHLPRHALVVETLQRMTAADLYLACACAQGDARAITAFEGHCLGSLDRTLARLGFGPDIIAEVKQYIRCRFLVAEHGRARIVDFDGRGALRAWVRVIAVRQALRMIRRSHRESGGDDIEQLQAFVAPPQLEAVKEHYGRAFTQAFACALRALPARDRTMLRQHVLDGLTIDQLGALYRLHRATAARSLERARRALLAATRAH